MKFISRLIFVFFSNIVLIFASPCRNQNNPGGVSVLEVTSSLSLEELVEIIRSKADPDKINWSDVFGYWKSDDQMFLLINSKMVKGPHQMTNVQWLCVILADLQIAKILELKSFSNVTLGEGYRVPNSVGDSQNTIPEKLKEVSKEQ